jgi:hypothetical protein
MARGGQEKEVAHIAAMRCDHVMAYLHELVCVRKVVHLQANISHNVNL